MVLLRKEFLDRLRGEHPTLLTKAINICLPWFIVFLAVCLGTATALSYQSVSTLSSEIKSALGISLDSGNTRWSFVYTIYSLPNIIMPFLLGIISDMFGMRVAMLISCSLVFVGTVIVNSSLFFPSFSVLLLGRLFIGLGGESVYMMNDTFSYYWCTLNGHQSLAMTLTAGSLRIGEISSYGLLPTVSSHFGLQSALFIVLCAFVCAIIVCAVLTLIDLWGSQKRWMKSRIIEQAGSGISFNIKDILRFPLSYWLLLSCLSLFFALMYPFIDSVSGVLQIQHGLDQSQAGWYVSITSTVALCAAPLCGIFLDYFGYKIYMAQIGFAFLFIGSFSLAFSWFSTVISMVFMGLAYATVSSAIWPCLGLTVPERGYTTAYGLAASCGNALSVVTYFLLGVMLDVSPLHFYGLLCGLSLVGIGLTICWQYVDLTRRQGICNLGRKRRMEVLLELFPQYRNLSETTDIEASDSDSPEPPYGSMAEPVHK